jgi:hypothetical protein
MTRRRLFFLLLYLVLAVLPAGLFRWHYPALSHVEHRLLGKWTAPEPNPRASFVTTKGAVTNPWRIWEFRRDRSFRVWVVSADDPGVSILDTEGLWSAEGGKLNIESFGAMGNALREVRERIRIRFGNPYVARSSGRLSHSI